MALPEPLRMLHVGWRDLAEVALVACAFYTLLRVVRGTRALPLTIGFIGIAAAWAAAWALQLSLVAWLLGLAMQYGVVLALIVFQAELRAALGHLGQTRLPHLARSLEEGEVVDEITDAVERLARSSTGAIVAIERDVPLAEYVETGREMSAKVSGDLLATIFTPYSPLHDGAVIVRGDAIIGAGCILPLSQTRVEDRSLGTRHRAALGLSEESDALVVVVSEESGAITLATRGRLLRGLSPTQLRELLLGRTPRSTMEHPAVVAPA